MQVNDSFHSHSVIPKEAPVITQSTYVHMSTNNFFLLKQYFEPNNFCLFQEGQADPKNEVTALIALIPKSKICNPIMNCMTQYY